MVLNVKFTKVAVFQVRDYTVVVRKRDDSNGSEEIPFGLCVWSTGNVALDFVKEIKLPLTRDQRIVIDPHLQIEGQPGIFAIGDCAANPQRPLAMLAQVANQQVRKEFLKRNYYKD